MSQYGQHSRAWLAWRMEQRKKHWRRFWYNALDDAGMVLWCLVGVIVTACVIFCVAHR